MFENQIGFMASLDFSSWKPEEVLQVLSTLGYKAVEWTLAHFNPRDKRESELENLVKITKDYGLEISEIVVQQDLVSLDNRIRKGRIEFVKECIQVTGELGINTINLFTGPAPWDPKSPKIPNDISETQAWEQVIEAFNEFIPLADKYKVYLAVEAVFGMVCHDYYTLKELLEQINSNWLAVNLDPSHYILYGNDIKWVIKRLNNRIRHVHLKDVIGKPGLPDIDFMFPMLGEGMVDWKVFFQSLEEIKYSGYCSVEFESFKYYRNILRSDPRKAAEISINQVKKLLELV